MVISTTPQPLWNLLGPERPTNIVDIGANPIDGTPPYRPLLSAGLCRLIGFEPQLEALAKLNAAKGESETYLPYVVGDGEPHTLNVCKAPGMTSLLTPNQTVLRCFHGFPSWGEVVERLPVETRRLDEIAEVSDLDYLKIDVQGSELSVFQGGRRKLADAVILQTEVSFIPLYEREPHFAEVDAELRSLGFVFHTFAALNRRALAPMLVNNDPYRGLNQIVEGDAVYVKDFTTLGKLAPEKLRQLALVAHACYQSYDLANLCILKLDQILGGSRQSQYGELLAALT